MVFFFRYPIIVKSYINGSKNASFCKASEANFVIMRINTIWLFQFVICQINYIKMFRFKQIFDRYLK